MLRGKHINVKELFAIFAAVVTWGDEWANMDVIIYTDNKPITQIWLTGTTKNSDIMTIIRKLFYFLADRNINIRLEHVFGYLNTKADLLSRLQVDKFMQATPGANEKKSGIPKEVWTTF